MTDRNGRVEAKMANFQIICYLSCPPGIIICLPTSLEMSLRSSTKTYMKADLDFQFIAKTFNSTFNLGDE